MELVLAGSGWDQFHNAAAGELLIYNYSKSDIAVIHQHHMIWCVASHDASHDDVVWSTTQHDMQCLVIMSPDMCGLRCLQLKIRQSEWIQLRLVA